MKIRNYSLLCNVSAGSGALGRAKTQQHTNENKNIINYSSMRITRKPGGYPVRRNTTRANQRTMHAR